MRNSIKIALVGILLIGSALLVKQASTTDSEVVLADNGLPVQAASPFLYDQVPLALTQNSSLVRLENEEGRFFCSGVVISKDLVLTAAHCVMSQDSFGGGGSMSTTPIQVKSEKIKGKKQTVAMAIAYQANPRADYAVIRGDFSKFNIALITTSNTVMYELSDNLVACGFPWGAATHVCYPLAKRANGKLMKSFAFGFDGFLYPGMSGGPVVDRKSGLVFAVNSAVDPDRDELVLVPLIGLRELINGDRE